MKAATILRWVLWFKVLFTISGLILSFAVLQMAAGDPGDPLEEPFLP